MTNEENGALPIDAWKLLVARLPTGKIQHSDGVTTMIGHVHLPFLNISVPDRPLADETVVRQALAITKERALTCTHAFLVALRDEWVPQDWKRTATEAGLKLTLNMTGMATDQLLQARRPAPTSSFAA